MRNIRIRRPSPALVIAILALFLASSGSAYAASKITSSQIAKGAVTQSKIAKKAVSTGKLATQSVGTAKLKDDAVTNDKLGDSSVGTNQLTDQSVTKGKLADNSVGAKQFGNVITRSANVTVAAGTTGTATAVCETNEKVISGGWNTTVTPAAVWLTQEDVRASAQNGWRVSGVSLVGSVALTVTAYCLEL